MITEKDNLQALKNRWTNEIKAREREILKFREGIKSVEQALGILDAGVNYKTSEEEAVTSMVVESGPTGKELVQQAIQQWKLSNPDKETFAGADLSKIIRATGKWTKKTPLANMVFMTLKRLVEAGEVKETKDGYKIEPLKFQPEKEPSQASVQS
jgi:hypothetical protein